MPTSLVSPFRNAGLARGIGRLAPYFSVLVACGGGTTPGQSSSGGNGGGGQTASDSWPHGGGGGAWEDEGGASVPQPLPPAMEEVAKGRDRFDESAKRLPGTTLPVPMLPTPFVDSTPKPLPPGCASGAAVYDVSAAKRRFPLPGLPDWSAAGYRKGARLPPGSVVLKAVDHGVVADDDVDDAVALQAAINAAAKLPRGYGNEVVVSLPAGRILLSREIKVNASHVILRGQGAHPHDPASTQIVVRPGPLMAYDKLSGDGSEPQFQEVTQGAGKGGWLWPGRGAFRVQSTKVHADYAADYAQADEKWKDIFEGTVNAHWKSGLTVDQSEAFPGRRGSRSVRLDQSNGRASLSAVTSGALVLVAAANSIRMYSDQGITDAKRFDNNYMRMQLFTVQGYDATTRTVTLDRPLEFDLPANSTSDGSKKILNIERPSKVVLIDSVENVGFENFFLTYDLNGLPTASGTPYNLHPADAQWNYGNMAPQYALHGIVFKWATDSWVRGVRMYMIGSHPVVTEIARNIQVERNVFEGSWNKGKGGNGYLRGSRVWDSLYVGNISRGLRHFTFQWSASGNVLIGNDLDSDVNLHGGWERHNLIELNWVKVPLRHASGSCRTHCGDESGGQDVGTWWPLWWGAGPKAGKWSGATGPQNVLFRNTMLKQTKEAGPFAAYTPYFKDDGSQCGTITQLGWDRNTPPGSQWEPLGANGKPIDDWLSHEQTDFSAGSNVGVNAARTEAVPSLFLAP